MLGSITPLGERGREQRWWLTICFYLLGSTAGGASFGLVLAAAGMPVVEALGTVNESLPLLMLGGAIALGLLLDVGVGGLTLPTIRRQVRQDWLTQYRGWVYGVGFGLQLGLGVVTIVSTSAVYTTFVACFLTGSPAAGALVGGAFGGIRAGTLLVVGRVRTPEQLDRVEPALERLGPPTRYAGYALLALLVMSILVVVTAGI